MHCKLLSFGLFVFFFYGQAKAQVQKADRDSLKIEKDSLQVVKDSVNYSAIETFSQKSKFTRFLHHLLFRPIVPEAKKQSKKSKTNKTKPFSKAEGRIIRNIYIVTTDPFGYNIRDTSIHPRGFLMKAGNNLHVKTNPVIIKNLLLFKRNEPYDSLLINESVRLIRSQKFVRDVIFYVLPVSAKKDSVDIYLRVSDVWSIGLSFGLSKTNLNTGLTDNNFAGMGSSFHGDLKHNRPERNNITRFSYFIPNIRNSYISINFQLLIPGKNDMVKNFEFARSYYSPATSNLHYLFSENKEILRSIEFKRPFYSPLAKWAGGIFWGQMIMAQSYISRDTIRYLSSRTNVQDYWGARSWQIYKGFLADGRITSFILSGRILITRFPGRPPEAESAHVFIKENSFFAGVGISSRKYIKDTFIFNYGKIEDFPVGRAIGITAGLNAQETNRLYLGFNASWGDYYRFGYLSTHFEYGTFKELTGFKQGVVTTRINYFTRLLNLGNWKLRQFVRPTLIFGINRLPSDNLTFSDKMKGFGSLEYSATQMMVLTLQTQSYPPWNLLGFHFGPYLFTSLGILGNETSGFSDSHIYSLFGLGVLIKNNYLTFNTFQISLTFYPFIPGDGYNIFKTNAYKTSDYGFSDFEISKPGVADYR